MGKQRIMSKGYNRKIMSRMNDNRQMYNNR